MRIARLRFSEFEARIWGAVIAVLFITAGSALAYVTQKNATPGIVESKWATSSFPVEWRLNPAQTSNITGTRTMVDVLTSSFAAWQGLSTSSVTFTQGANTSVNAVQNAMDGINIVKANHTPAEYLTIAGDALGRTFTTTDLSGRILDTDIVFNPSVTFSTDPTTPSNRIDFQSVATHEIGHLLGLDHSSILSATMFPTLGDGVTYPRVPSADDIAGISSLYPTTSFANKGMISGTVRFANNSVVYGALVVAVDAEGKPAASTISDPQGNYTIMGLDPGNYTIFAEPMDQPYGLLNVSTLSRIYPGLQPVTSFTTRFR